MRSDLIEYRWACESDLDRLVVFFRKAYGALSIFSDPNYLLNYFKNRSHSRLNCFIALYRDEIVAHYGIREQNFIWDLREVTISWGVNAFTLPQSRGLSLGLKLIEKIRSECEILGVIGFSHKTAEFYHDLGFEMFDYKRFDRWILPLKDNFLYTVHAVEGNSREILKLMDKLPKKELLDQPENGVKSFSFEPVKFQVSKYIKITALRDLNTTSERFINDLGINYEINISKDESSYMVTRREILEPINETITRVVDLAGPEKSLSTILQKMIKESMLRGDIYFEFFKWGAKVYDSLFHDEGFIHLQDDLAASVPLVSSPVMKRENNEYFGLWCHPNSNLKIPKCDEIFLTRSSSDRDRLGKRK